MKIPENIPFTLVAIAAIIQRCINGRKYILLQNRIRIEVESENGLIEVPSGKVKRCCNIYKGLVNRVKAETGLALRKIGGYSTEMLVEQVDDNVISAKPFCITQSVVSDYPVLTCFFICEADGENLDQTDAAYNIRWVDLDDLNKDLYTNPERYFPPDYKALCEYIDFNKTDGKLLEGAEDNQG